MSSVIKVTVSINTDGIADKLNKLCQDKTLMLDVYNLFAKKCDPYVPFLHGPLSKTVEITPEYIRYIQPYSRRQYYGDDFHHTLDFHPLASARWDKAMMRDKKEEFEDEVEERFRRRYKELYG